MSVTQEVTAIEKISVDESNVAIDVNIVDAVIKDGATKKKKKKKKSNKKEGRLSRRLSSISEKLQKQYAVFKLKVEYAGSKTWTVEKEYNDFRRLHNTLAKKLPGVDKMVSKFPRNNFFLKLKPELVQQQREYFESYLQAVTKLSPCPADVNEFLSVNVNLKKKGGIKTPELKDFELVTLIGMGSFGKVYLVRVIASDKMYAMKVLNKEEVARRRQVEHTKTELRVMGASEHPFIVNLRYAFQTKNRLFMISDFCRGGELFFHLKKLRVLSEDIARFYAAEIALALDYLHKKDIVYRDLKPENVLITEDGHIKLTDFGLSREGVAGETDATTFCGTPEYLSPEMILHYRHKTSGYGKGVDWWSLGTLIYEMLCGIPPFYHRNVKKMCERILTDKLTFDRGNMSVECKDIVTGFLKRDPGERLGTVGQGFEEVKNHLFFKEIDWELLYQRKVKPEFIPELSNDVTDTSNFEEVFTKEAARLSVEKSKDDTGYDAFEDFDFIKHTVKGTPEEFNNNFWSES